MGAVKKVKSLIKYIMSNIDVRYTVFDKTRDTTNGKLSNSKLLYGEILPEDNLWVVDDICDGGGTFVQLYKSITANDTTKFNSINLIVSHGLYTNDLNYKELNEMFTRNLCIYKY